METATGLSVQDLHLALIRQASFNNLDGDAVADSLTEARALWKGAMMSRGAYFTEYARTHNGAHCDPIDDIQIRDLPTYWNVDTLYLTPHGDCEQALETLARTWQADEIDWQDFPNAGRVLRVWWD